MLFICVTCNALSKVVLSAAAQNRVHRGMIEPPRGLGDANLLLKREGDDAGRLEKLKEIGKNVGSSESRLQCFLTR